MSMAPVERREGSPPVEGDAGGTAGAGHGGLAMPTAIRGGRGRAWEERRAGLSGSRPPRRPARGGGPGGG